MPRWQAGRYPGDRPDRHPVKGTPDGLYLVLGTVEPAIVLDEDARKHLVDDLLTNGVKVAVQGRFHLSRQLADELMRVLAEAVNLYDAVVGAELQSQPSEDTRTAE